MGQLHKLTAMKVDKQKAPGVYGDGGGLWLQVSEAGGKFWIFRFTLNGRARWMGLGPVHTVSLAEARDHAMECRKMVRAGIDPIEFRNAKDRQYASELARAMATSVTFAECSKRYIAAHREGWKNAKHITQWENTLATYCAKMNDTPVSVITTGQVMECLNPIWTTKAETASRLRGRIEAILDYAKVMEWREGDNPARWKGHLDHLLPPQSRIKRIEHFPALPYAQIAAFMVELRKEEGIGAKAVEFAILTAARSGEVRGAVWGEFDLDSALWTVPAERMKAKKEHRVPLSAKAVALLRDRHQATGGKGLVFPGRKKDTPLSDMSLTAVVRRMDADRQDREQKGWRDAKGDLVTVHGFRSSFRDWGAECTAYPNEVLEMALAHAIDGKVEAAYRRGDLFDKRRRLMEEWAAYCDTIQQSGEVIPIRGNAAA